MKTPVGIAFGFPGVKVRATVTKKIEKWFLLGMRYCNQTLYIASLYENPSWYCIWTPWGKVTVTKNRKMVSGQ
jgi:hypothetical protein